MKINLVILLNSSRCSRIYRIAKIWSVHPLFDLKPAWLGLPQYNGSNMFFITDSSIWKAIAKKAITLFIRAVGFIEFLEQRSYYYGFPFGWHQFASHHGSRWWWAVQEKLEMVCPFFNSLLCPELCGRQHSLSFHWYRLVYQLTVWQLSRLFWVAVSSAILHFHHFLREVVAVSCIVSPYCFSNPFP